MEVTRPDPTWDAKSHEETVDVFANLNENTHFKVWAADWCGDARRELPSFFAALDAADIPEDRIEIYELDRDKNGELVDDYDVQYIATIVVVRDGKELARFEEQADLPAAQAIAGQLAERE